MGLVAREACWPGIEWLLKLRFADESKKRGGICSSDRYRMHLFCLVVQASFYSYVVKCWPISQTAQVQSRDAALVIRIFSCYKYITKKVRVLSCTLHAH